MQFFRYLRKYRDLYILLVPGILYALFFKYSPLYGLLIAFKEFDIFAGKNAFDSILQSPWVGLGQFTRIFMSEAFLKVLSNTLIISTYKIIFIFPLPLTLAILINELRTLAFKKAIQTVLYLPHFISWVVVSGLFLSLLGSTGIVNKIILGLGYPEPLYFFMRPDLFRPLIVLTDAWKSMGWSSIIYLAAIAGIDPQLYEAAIVDGAGKVRQVFSITLPSLFTTIILLLILRVGHILDAGFEQVMTMYNPLVYDVADILQTYVYRVGLGQMNFSMGTAVGLFNSVIALTLILSCNKISRMLLGRSIW